MTAAAPPKPGPPPAPTDWDLDVFVPGKPVTKGSAYAVRSRSTGRPLLKLDNGDDQKVWAGLIHAIVLPAWRTVDVSHITGVAGQTGQIGRAPTTEPVHIHCEFVMPRRKGAPKRSTPAHTRKPDGDKLVRCVWDALTDVVIADDSQVVSWSGSKREAEPDEQPGARIAIAVLPS